MKAMTAPVVNQPTIVTGDNPHYLVRGVKRHPSTQASESHDLHIKSGDGNINAYSYLPSQRRSPCATFSSYRR